MPPNRIEQLLAKFSREGWGCSANIAQNITIEKQKEGVCTPPLFPVDQLRNRPSLGQVWDAAVFDKWSTSPNWRAENYIRVVFLVVRGGKLAQRLKHAATRLHWTRPGRRWTTLGIHIRNFMALKACR